MNKNYIEIKKVSKIYKNNFAALKNIELQIQKGEIFALLGPNGAGKSTLINVLCGLTYHSEGDIFIDGIDLSTNRKKNQIFNRFGPSGAPFRGFWNCVR